MQNLHLSLQAEQIAPLTKVYSGQLEKQEF
jgi:hypothetical protein